MSNMPERVQSIKQTVTDSVIPVREEAMRWFEPFQKTQPQRDAARILGKIGIGSLGFGAGAAALMMLRRKNEQKLLDEEKAKAQLHVPVFVPVDENRKKKEASAGRKAIAVGLGLLGLGSTAAGIAYANDGKDGKDSANPAARVFNTATGIIPGGQAFRDEQDRYLDLPGTIRGDHAKSYENVPWFAPGVLGVSLLGLGAGYGGINALGNMAAKWKLERKKKKAKKMHEDALMGEYRSKLGSVLDEYVTLCEELAPSVKEASMLEWYLALLGTAGVAGGLAGTYNGFQGAKQKHRLTALKKIREMQLAKRRSEELHLVPDYRPLPPEKADPEKKPERPTDEELDDDITVPQQKSADLIRQLAKGLWRGTKYLGGKTVKGVSGTSRQAAKVPRYLAKEQPLTTATVGGLLAAEGAGRVADHYGSPLGQWKPSQWITNRFMENQPLTDANGNPVWGTRRLYSGDPNDFAEMKWSWNPLSERGFGWRFRKQPRPRRRVLVTDSDPSITELVRKSNPSTSMRRRMNERFYDYDHQRADAGPR